MRFHQNSFKFCCITTSVSIIASKYNWRRSWKRWQTLCVEKLLPQHLVHLCEFNRYTARRFFIVRSVLSSACITRLSHIEDVDIKNFSRLSKCSINKWVILRCRNRYVDKVNDNIHNMINCAFVCNNNAKTPLDGKKQPQELNN